MIWSGELSLVSWSQYSPLIGQYFIYLCLYIYWVPVQIIIELLDYLEYYFMCRLWDLSVVAVHVPKFKVFKNTFSPLIGQGRDQAVAGAADHQQAGG